VDQWDTCFNQQGDYVQTVIQILSMYHSLIYNIYVHLN
jgi:hypothetical protein